MNRGSLEVVVEVYMVTNQVSNCSIGEKVFLFKSIIIFIAYLSYDVASGSDIRPHNKIDESLVVYRFSGNIMK